MALKIYNSLTKQKDTFEPLHKGYVGMYVCGPTVYGPPHLGHARSYVNFDTIYRYLMFSGYKVKYVQNITDVGHLVGDGDDGEDKIMRQAQKEQVDPYEIAYKYENLYFDAMGKLNVLKPSISARATGNIPEIIDMIQKILDKGYGYVTSRGNVYFSVRKFAGYGKLSNRTLDNNLSGERISVADDKREKEDFALWKSSEGGHLMKWNSPWGVGYPGWHIECSTLCKKFLGDTVDIHGGGIDNIFPHHDCEIAQSEIANGKPFVRYFIHNNLITINGTKMGKSLGNFVTLEELFNQFDPMYVRYFILQFSYRSPVDFTNKAIADAGAQYEKIKEVYLKLKEATGSNSKKATDKTLLDIREKFINSMDEDFNTPLAIAELLKLTKFAGSLTDQETLREALGLFDEMAYVLGLKFETLTPKSDDKEDKLLDIISSVRAKLRQEKQYALSDYIRDELAKNGIEVKDKKI